jgi:hypothetical protein
MSLTFTALRGSDLTHEDDVSFKQHVIKLLVL